jgi:hypothetical protein
MKTFPHWRAVGRAMLDARRREGVTVDTTTVTGYYFAEVTENRWRSELATVEVRPGEGGTHLDIHRINYAAVNFWPVRDAAEVLRVLAALDLTPADIAYAADERYGRCQVPGCKRIARWWPAEAHAAGRWVHEIANDERFVDYPDHPVEVAP